MSDFELCSNQVQLDLNCPSGKVLNQENLKLAVLVQWQKHAKNGQTYSSLYTVPVDSARK